MREPRSYVAPAPKKSGARVPLLITLMIVLLLLIASVVYTLVSGELPFSGLWSSGETAQTESVIAVDPPAQNNPQTQETQGEKTETQNVAKATSFVGAHATSTLGDMGEHNYSASNVLKDDGTCWCEGAKGYGEGESITLELPEEQLLSGLYIRNGYAGTSKQYEENGKINDIEITFSNGQKIIATLKTLNVDQRKARQKITFPTPVATGSVTITIKSVTKAKYEDTCLTSVEPF